MRTYALLAIMLATLSSAVDAYALCGDVTGDKFKDVWHVVKE